MAPKKLNLNGSKEKVLQKGLKLKLIPRKTIYRFKYLRQ